MYLYLGVLSAPEANNWNNTFKSNSGIYATYSSISTNITSLTGNTINKVIVTSTASVAGNSYDKLILLFNENLNDSSNRNHTVVNNGNATISTSVKKYGSGSGDYPLNGYIDYFNFTVGTTRNPSTFPPAAEPIGRINIEEIDCTQAGRNFLAAFSISSQVALLSAEIFRQLSELFVLA